MLFGPKCAWELRPGLLDVAGSDGSERVKWGYAGSGMMGLLAGLVQTIPPSIYPFFKLLSPELSVSGIKPVTMCIPVNRFSFNLPSTRRGVH